MAVKMWLSVHLSTHVFSLSVCFVQPSQKKKITSYNIKIKVMLHMNVNICEISAHFCPP